MPLEPFTPDTFPGQKQVAAGITVADPPNVHPEDGLSVPWAVDPRVSWLDYRCWVEIELDAGMALHKPLPQSYPSVDSLGTVDILAPDADIVIPDGLLHSSSNATDIIQRMATSEYRFLLKGWGLRIGYQIPIPSLKRVGNAIAVPEGKQRAFNVVTGNVSGIPLFYAAWELPYVIATPLGSRATAPIPHNPAFHIRADAQLPLAILLPRAPKDDRAVAQQKAEKGGGAIPRGGLP